MAELELVCNKLCFFYIVKGPKNSRYINTDNYFEMSFCLNSQTLMCHFPQFPASVCSWHLNAWQKKSQNGLWSLDRHVLIDVATIGHFRHFYVKQNR